MAASGFIDEGVAVLRYGIDPFNHDDDQLTRHGSGQLPSNNVNTLAFDRDNLLWAGTNLGLAYYDAEIEFFRYPVVLPPGISSNIRDIAVDSRNNLWVATSDGLGFIGDKQSEKFALTTENSALVSDDIQDLSFDPTSGRLLIFTKAGLSILDYGLTGEDSSAAVFAYPNPFVITEQSEAVLQFKINQRGEAKIYSVAGELVRTTDVNTGWDGRNDHGDFVASGVYIYQLLAEDQTRHHGKIFVLRR